MRIKYQVVIALATKYSTPSTDQRLELRAAICHLQVLPGEENTFISLNMGLICFTTNKNAREPQREQEEGCSCSAAKPKDDSIKMRAVDQKKRKIKSLYLQKSRDIVKAECGNSPSEPGGLSAVSALSTQAASQQFPQNNDQLCCTKTGDSTDGSESKLAARACVCLPTRPPEDGSRCFPPTDWGSFEGVKNGSQKSVFKADSMFIEVWEAVTLLSSERIRCDFTEFIWA